MLETIIAFTVVAWFGTGEQGTTAFPLLRVPVGSRACALGEAFTATADDQSALLWNPGGLGQLSSIELGLSHHEWFAGIRDENVGLALPLGPGCIGAGAVYSAVRDIEVRDGTDSPGTTATAQSGFLALGYGLPVTRHLYCGASVKGLYDDLIDETGTGVCADAGVLYRPLSFLGLGLAGRNLGFGVAYGTERYRLPIVVSLGASLTGGSWRSLLDVNLTSSGSPELHAGAEYGFHNLLWLRGGYHLGPQDWRGLTLMSGMTAGLGVRLGRLAVDYAVAPSGQLGVIHRVTLTSSFPAPLYGRVRIRVRELKIGAPVAARFLLAGVQQGNSYTADDGTFVINDVEPGWLTVTALADGYHAAIESVLVAPRTTHTLVLAATRFGFGSFWGAVQDSVSHVPVSASIEYSGPETGRTVTDPANGSFVLRKLKAGDYDFVVTPHDTCYPGQTATVTVPAGSLVSQTFLLSRGSTPAAATPAPPANSEAAPPDQPSEPGPATPDR